MTRETRRAGWLARPFVCIAAYFFLLAVLAAGLLGAFAAGFFVVALFACAVFLAMTYPPFPRWSTGRPHATMSRVATLRVRVTW